MKKYSVIYADSPWQTKAGRALKGYKIENGKQLFVSSSNKSRELAYPTMTVEQLCKMPISDLAAENAHLYFWTTNQYLMQSLQVIESWGFKYSTTLVWAKNPMGGGLGGNYKITTEFLIFATRGNLKAKEKHIGTWFNIKREYQNGSPCHSRKPEFFADLIEKVSPGPYLELFARRERIGWDVFGNQVENSINIKVKL
jgi:N6-adenosine-specific RNA methylase IME4